jgi:hypothetical protein
MRSSFRETQAELMWALELELMLVCHSVRYDVDVIDGLRRWALNLQSRARVRTNALEHAATNRSRIL